MYLTEEILDKLNAGNKTTGHNLQADAGGQITLSDIMVRSFAEVKALAGDALTWGEKNFLYQQAQQALKENKMAESRILSRANPQLTNAVRLGIRQSSMLDGYGDLFPQRASSFVKPGSVASMFSPAGYLTELYREARNLHQDTSQYHLDTRRPDLASLSLSQSDMDDELSTLSLSNELLLNNIQSKESLSYDDVIKNLATYRQTEATPFHLPYEATRQAILLQDPAFKAFRNNPSVAAKMNTSSLLGITADISPELHNILTEEITEDKVDALVKENFGDINLINFQNAAWLAHWYGLTYDEISSLLGLITGMDNIMPGMQYYQNDQLITLVSSGESLNAVLMKRTVKNNSNNVKYAELIPVEDGYLLNLSFSDTRPDYQMLQIKDGDNVFFEYDNPNLVPDANEALQLSLAIDANKLTAAGGLDLLINRWSSEAGESGFTSTINFQQSTYPYSTFLLKLNKLVRLYKATGISLSDIRTVIESVNDDLRITDDVLSRLFWVNYYAQRHGVDFSAALVLAGANISQITHSGKDSAFTRLFNTLPLNNQLFSADGTVLNLEPGKSEDTFRLGALKRALQVDETGLYTLYTLTFTDKDSEDKTIDFTTTIDNLSALYRTRLLAEVNQLTVTELSLLLSVSPYAGQKLDTLKGEALNGLSAALDRYTQWLSEMSWTVSDLYLMLTTSYSTVLSPDINNLIDTLKNGLASHDLSDASETELITAAAPFIAAATQLDSAETAVAVLMWLDQLKPQGLTVKDFLVLVDNDSRNDQDTVRMVSFCQVLGQLALIVRNAGLSAAGLTWVVAHPATFVERATELSHDISTLYELTQLHALLARCGIHASEVLTSLSGDAKSMTRLSVETVATALNINELALAQALAQVSNYNYFYSWIHLRDALQWLDVATTFNITPDKVKALTELNNSSAYSDWQAGSHFMQAGLNAQQTAKLAAVLDEGLSAAASTYVIKNIAPKWVSDRDKLYSWLLIDNQVSAQIKTTRIAEAIASVQLYVNRALTGQEQGVVSEVKSKHFFTSDWDTYNKRYATWAGVSELVYYPENYLDPTLRLGQTGMMDEMLQTLSQSQLTSDTVEAAFKTYMTRFEEIANLDVISGYHDSVSDQNGATYIIGRSAIGDYYWRSADIEKMSDGKLPANAWTEWQKITTALTPVSNLVRPVIFQSRLYLVWIEGREVATSDNNETTQSTEYQLKYAHILHDGNWSTPVTVTLQSGTFPLLVQTDENLFKPTDANDIGMYCSFDVLENCLSVIFYEKKAAYSENPRDISGVVISSDHSATVTTDFWIFAYLQFDTLENICLNTPKIQPYAEIKSSESIWGDDSYSAGTGGKVNPRLIMDSSDIELDFDAESRLVFGNPSQTSKDRQIDLLKKTGDIGECVLLARYIENNTLLSGVALSMSSVTIKKIVDGKTSYITYLYSDNISMSRPDLSFEGIYNEDDILGEDNFKYDKATDCVFFEHQDSPDTIVLIIHYGTLDFCEFAAGDFIKMDTSKLELSYSVTLGDGRFYEIHNGPLQAAKNTWDETLYYISGQIDLSSEAFEHDIIEATFKYSITGGMYYFGGETFTYRLNFGRTVPIISMIRTNTSAQYLQYGVHRIRVNTLFAKQLVSRANAGLNSVLTMETQQLQEPKLGQGAYVGLVLNRYDADVNGISPAFKILMCDVFTDGDRFTLASGTLSTTQQTSVTFFLPRLDESTASPANMYFCVQFQSGESLKIEVSGSEGRWVLNDPTIDYQGISQILVSNKTTEPMDFSGANALYFWEMFYYVPMMVFKRLLSESKFTEATQWIKYIWSPDGYLVNDQPATYVWNVRPLEEETSWHADALNSVDPDAVAQADPLHYKIATFMAYLDLLIARGDAAYRMLERDTLNEAKMWYVQALDLLGEEPYLPQAAGWASPRLTDAAEQTTQKNTQQALMAVRQQVSSAELRTANSLTSLFLPQQNGKLSGYWQTLAQRLYNLRHNLSIDGNPLSLAIYAKPADPAALLSAAVNASLGGSDLPVVDDIPLYRFPVILESARSMVGQLTQFGSTLLSITERQDAEALSELLQAQGTELIRQSIALQNSAIAEIDADKTALEESLSGAQSRLDSYTTLYDEDVNTGEMQAMKLFLSSSSLADGGQVFHTAAGVADLVPNIFGLADGGSRWGAAFTALAGIADLSASATHTAADRISQSEMYRRRRQEWEIQRNNAESEVKQINAQLDTLAVRREGAVLQKTWLETQQSQTQAQMTFLQNKFTSKALYNWLRGKLAAIYYQFYDLTVSRCLMAEKAYRWALSTESVTFIRPGAWQSTWAGLMAGETLMLNLAQMEQSYLQKDQREKEVTHTSCLSEFYGALSSDKFTLDEQITALVNTGSGSAGSETNGLNIQDKQLQATLTLSDLKIGDDYPASLGNTRRIKQISVTLPALVGPYQDVRAVLSYGGSVILPQGCTATTVSHGMNDSGQFQLDFNDSRWLPFEGIPVGDKGKLTLSFPDATGKQKDLLLSLTDIILHIRYTIAS